MLIWVTESLVFIEEFFSEYCVWIPICRKFLQSFFWIQSTLMRLVLCLLWNESLCVSFIIVIVQQSLVVWIYCWHQSPFIVRKERRYIMLYEDVCIRSRYIGHGYVIITHRILNTLGCNYLSMFYIPASGTCLRMLCCVEKAVPNHFGNILVTING